MKLVIYGAGQQGRSMLRLIREINKADACWDEILFAEDKFSERDILGHKVYPFAEILENFESGEVEFIISVGEPKFRRELFETVEKAGYSFCDLINPNKEDINYNSFGRGVIVGNNVGISNNIDISDNVRIGSRASIGHDTTIGKHSLICGSAVIGGGCTIGDGVFIGSNATIRDHTSIGSNVIVSMGACVFKDLPNDVKVMGNPAQIVPSIKGHKVFS